jgi:glyceraldehyde-3-phosphate dehydrogenase/erythrose-4-phosphate dehydrogenase
MAVRVGSTAGAASVSRPLIERTPDVESWCQRSHGHLAEHLLFRHDSTYGAYPGTVDHTDDALIIDGRIKVSRRPIRALPWGTSASTLVLESTGIFTDADKAP